MVTQKQKMEMLERVGQPIPAAEVLSTLGQPPFFYGSRPFGSQIIDMGSQRYQVFAKSTTCVACGLDGTHFCVECHPGSPKYHLNLYGVDKDGDEVLMTKDHIIPRSKGGKNVLDNYQTMCRICNLAKGNVLPTR